MKLKIRLSITLEIEAHSEAIPYVGVDPSNGATTVDLEKGGLVMERETATFPCAENELEFTPFAMDVMRKVYQTHAN